MIYVMITRYNYDENPQNSNRIKIEKGVFNNGIKEQYDIGKNKGV